RVMNDTRSTTTGRVLVDRHHVAAQLALIVDQRVAADHAVRQMQIDVTAGSERSEITACGSHQLVRIDVLRLIADAFDANLHRALSQGAGPSCGDVTVHSQNRPPTARA